MSGKVEVHPLDGAAKVIFACAVGPRFKFGKVAVTATGRSPPTRTSPPPATGLSRGDTDSPAAIALAQQRVYNLGAFSGVRVGLEPLGDTPVAALRLYRARGEEQRVADRA